LAEQVNLPSSKFTVGNVNLSTLQFPFPKGFETPSFSVVYLEDELESVYRFHRVWQANIHGSYGNEAGVGLQFEPLGKVCCQALYSPTKRLGATFDNFFLCTDIPLGAEVWPYIFPSDIQRSPANKAGSGVSKTTVVYTRVPNISEWNKVERTKGAVPTQSRESTASELIEPTESVLSSSVVRNGMQVSTYRER